LSKPKMVDKICEYHQNVWPYATKTNELTPQRRRLMSTVYGQRNVQKHDHLYFN